MNQHKSGRAGPISRERLNRTNRALSRILPELYIRKEWRPTIFVIVQNHEGLFGAGIQNTDERQWGFVQGGIEKGESHADAALRELAEETGIRQEEIERFEPTIFAGRHAGSNSKEFSKGGVYIGNYVRLKPNVEVNLSLPESMRQELLCWRWGTADELCRLFVEQPGTMATDRTRSKGRAIFCPALHEIVRFLAMGESFDELLGRLS